MAKRLTGRAIVHFTYRSSRGKQYNSVLLGLERANGKYGLPGGQLDRRKDKDTLDAAIRELDEEFGLKASREGAQFVYRFSGRVCDHDVYVVNATGRVNIDLGELLGIGFYNAGRHNQIPDRKLERHVQELKRRYFGTRHERKTASGIIIPGFYFTGNTNRRMQDWHTQRRGF